MKVIAAITICLMLGACQHGPSDVASQVMIDFGLKEKPEGYVSGTDRVMAALEGVGRTEMNRLNMEQRQGAVKYQEDGVHGKYYKQVKKFEKYHALDAQPTGRTPDSDQGYSGYVEYSYRVFESERKNTRAEAEEASANIPTGESGREVYRYHFNTGGMWDGAKGEETRR